MHYKAFVVFLFTGVLAPTVLCGQEQPAAVLLLPESDMDRELADDLTEVLISSVFEKSGRKFRIQGKEGFRMKLADKTAADGFVCLNDLNCVRKTGQEIGLELLVFGKVGKAANGYRLEVWKLATRPDGKDRSFRKGVSGDVGKLIEEMDAVATWALKQPKAMLTVTVEPADTSVKINDKVIPTLGKPFEVDPGKHNITGQKKGYKNGSVSVECKEDKPCSATLTLKAEAGPIKPPDDGKPAQKSRRISSGTIVATSIFAGIALVAGGTGVYMYAGMKSSESDANQVIKTICPNNTCTTTEKTFFSKLDPIIADGEEKALWASIMGGVAAASAVTAATILIIDIANGPNQKPAETTFAPRIGPDFTGFSLDIRF
jgi:hypothetical protein